MKPTPKKSASSAFIMNTYLASNCIRKTSEYNVPSSYLNQPIKKSNYLVEFVILSSGFSLRLLAYRYRHSIRGVFLDDF